MKYVIGVFLFLSTNCLLLAVADEGYELEAEVGDDWGGLCHSGHSQSPINVDYDLHREDLTILHFWQYDNVLKNAKIRNTGHTLQIDIPADQEYFIAGGGLTGGRYKMGQMHFHWLSEHRLYNKNFQLELHIVSYNERYKDISEAIKVKHGVAVVSVLFHTSDQPHAMLTHILDSAVPIRDKPGQSNAINVPFKPIQLLPDDRLSWFRYEGSLTTPDCNEGVIWTVMEHTLPITTAQAQRFQEALYIDGNTVQRNNRKIQPRNDRVIIYYRLDFRNSDGSSNDSFINLPNELPNDSPNESPNDSPNPLFSSAVQFPITTMIIITTASCQLLHLYY